MPLFSRRRREQPQEEITRHDIRRRRAERLGGLHVEDFVLGANDGVITTFAVIAGATGGSLGSTTILILGYANLFADGLSMGASNYLGKRSRHDYIESQRRMEEWEVEHVPGQEKEEVRRIFGGMGLHSEQLDAVVQAVTQNKRAWVDVMMAGELSLSENGGSPLKHGLVTLAAFIIAGAVPLIPYLACSGPGCFQISTAASAVTMFTAGALRTLVTGVNWFRGGLEMLAVGSAAGTVAYGVGQLLAAVV